MAERSGALEPLADGGGAVVVVPGAAGVSVMALLLFQSGRAAPVRTRACRGLRLLRPGDCLQIIVEI
jgi:hypothetical protein